MKNGSNEGKGSRDTHNPECGREWVVSVIRSNLTEFKVTGKKGELHSKYTTYQLILCCLVSFTKYKIVVQVLCRTIFHFSLLTTQWCISKVNSSAGDWERRYMYTCTTCSKTYMYNLHIRIPVYRLHRFMIYSRLTKLREFFTYQGSSMKTEKCSLHIFGGYCTCSYKNVTWLIRPTGLLGCQARVVVDKHPNPTRKLASSMSPQSLIN